MLILNPRIVRFGTAVWETVAAITIDRMPQRTIEVFGDLGPYATFADVPEQRVRIRIVQQSTRQGINAPKPGDQSTLSFHTSPTAGDAHRRKVSTTAVVLSVEHELSLKNGALRTITLAAVSTTGAADPITISNL